MPGRNRVFTSAHSSSSRPIPKVTGIVETALYVDNVERAVKFYTSLFGFELLAGDDHFSALNVSNQQVLLLFKRGESNKFTQIPGGVIPAHDGNGPVHVGFAVPVGSLPDWEKTLAANGVMIESRVTWPRGGGSLYFRDPDQHLVEVLTPGVWAMY